MQFAKETKGLGTLFKYLPPPKHTPYSEENLVDILHRGKVRLTSPAEVNDPYENCPSIEGEVTDEHIANLIARIIDRGAGNENIEYQESREALIRRIGGKAGIQPNIRTLHAQYAGTFRDFVIKPFETSGFVSLTELSNSMLMWAHYAANHQGICIGWNPAGMEFPGTASPVNYTPDRPVINIGEFARADGSMDHGLIPQILSTKNIDWSYEKEWRFYGVNLETKQVLKRGAKFDFDRKHISCIVFGSHCSEETKKFVMAQIADLDKKPTLHLARVSRTQYTLEVVEEK